MPVLYAPAPQELGSAQATADQSFTTQADITGVTVTVTVGSRAIEIEYEVPLGYNTSATSWSGIHLMEDGVEVDIAGAIAPLFNAASGFVCLKSSCRRTPAAGSHTYKLQAHSSATGGGTYHTNASATAAARIWVREV